MKQSLLKDLHQSLGARFTIFGGWEMPLSYKGTVAEHLSCRERGVIFDVSHLGCVLLDKKDSYQVIQNILTNDLSKIAPGRAQYTHLLNDSGGVVDDIILWWVKPEQFFIMPNATNTKNVLNILGGTDITLDRVFVAIQGPQVRDLFSDILPAIKPLKKNDVVSCDILNETVIIGCTGYTGEDGFEVFCSKQIATILFNHAVKKDVLPAGLGARDTLRLEAGLPLYGHELKEDITPLEANLEWVVSWNKDFIGKKALLRQKEEGVLKRLIGLTSLTRKPLRDGLEIFMDTHEAGVITSGNYSPCLKCGIALAYVKTEFCENEYFEIRSANSNLKVKRTPYPFVKHHK